MGNKIPYAKMLEDGIKKLTEGKAQNAVLCGLLEDGTTCVAYAKVSRSGRIDTLELLADALGISIDEYVGHKVMVKNHA